MGKECSKYSNNHPLDGVYVCELFVFFIHFIFYLENCCSSSRNCILIYFVDHITQLSFLERMQKDDVWSHFYLNLDVCSNTVCLSYPYPEQYLLQNRIIRSGNNGPNKRACNISKLHMVSQSSSSLLQVHRSVQRKANIREVRTRTVSECCAGYVQLYLDCVPQCSDCNNFNCNSTTNQCVCLPGFIGSQCNETCEDGKWGEQCSEVCTCRVGEDCDKVSGTCSPKKNPESLLPESTVSSTMTTNSSQSVAETSVVSVTPATPLQTFHDLQVTNAESNFITVKPHLIPTNHNTTLYTKLPTITPTSSFEPATLSTVIHTFLKPPIENFSTKSLDTAFFITKSTISPVSSFDIPIQPTLQSFVRSDLPFDSKLEKLNNTISTTSIYNITPSINVNKMTEDTLPITLASEIHSTLKPQEKTTLHKEIISSSSLEHNKTLSTVISQLQEPLQKVTPVTIFEPSEAITTQGLKPVMKELFNSVNETLLSTLIIPQESYSRDINISHPELNLNTTKMYAEWINELSTNTGVTVVVALVLLVLVIVSTSVIVHCCGHKKSQTPNSKQIQLENATTLISRSSHYDIPGPPTFSFINAYALELLTKDICETQYDHPCSARCLVNEPVYDELRY